MYTRISCYNHCLNNYWFEINGSTDERLSQLGIQLQQGCHGQGTSKSQPTVSEKSGNFDIWLAIGFPNEFPCWKRARSFLKLSAKQLINVASSLALLPKDLSLVVSFYWFVVSEYSGNVFLFWWEATLLSYKKESLKKVSFEWD